MSFAVDVAPIGEDVDFVAEIESLLVGESERLMVGVSPDPDGGLDED